MSPNATLFYQVATHFFFQVGVVKIPFQVRHLLHNLSDNFINKMIFSLTLDVPANEDFWASKCLRTIHDFWTFWGQKSVLPLIWQIFQQLKKCNFLERFAKVQNVFQLCFASANSRNFLAGHKISNEITAFFHEFSHSKSHWQLHFQEILKNWQKRTAVFIADIWRSESTFLRQIWRWQILKYQKHSGNMLLIGIYIDWFLRLLTF